MKVQKYCFIGICVFFFIKCSQKDTNSNPCANEISLFSTSDTLKNITIDYQLKGKNFTNSIDEKLEKLVCGALTNFGLILENQEVIKVQYRKKCQDGIGMISCYKEQFSIKALLNEKGSVLFAYESIPIDSIKYWIRDNFWDDGTYYYDKTSVQWETETPKDSIEKVLSTIKDGYLLIYEKLSQKLFAKKVCELQPAEMQQLKEQLLFTIQLNMEYKIPPPPPPIPAASVYK